MFRFGNVKEVKMRMEYFSQKRMQKSDFIISYKMCKKAKSFHFPMAKTLFSTA